MLSTWLIDVTLLATLATTCGYVFIYYTELIRNKNTIFILTTFIHRNTLYANIKNTS